MRKHLKELIIISATLFYVSCEDDALLEPKLDGEADKGSYGNLFLPGDTDSSKVKKIKTPKLFNK